MSRSRTRERRQQRESANRQRNLLLGAAGLVAAVVIVAVILLTRSSQIAVDVNEIADESIEFANLGQEHIEVGAPHELYNSNPPTSGPHYASPVRADVYDQELPDENLVHNLEHGHIWLSYRDASDQEAIDLATEIQSQYPRWVVVTHRPDNNNRLVAASWLRLLVLDELNEDQIQAFILRYRNRAPESIPG
jgi:hypothetical protein